MYRPHGRMVIFAFMNWTNGANLKDLNTFGLAAKTNRLGMFVSTDELISALADIDFDQEPFMILGGGSNMLLTSDFDGTILLNRISGIEVVQETDDHVWVEAGGGEVWHDFVLWTIEKGFGGIENLSLIPGSVGAAPIQNIGAYGVEIKDTFSSCQAVELRTGKLKAFGPEECDFGYRWSIFKGPLKGQYAITSVTFKLSKKPTVNTKYGAIQEQLSNMGVFGDPTIKEVSDAVIAIRQSKLPDPAEIGNSGSFFKNPVVSETKYHGLKADFPELIAYPAAGSNYKIAAGWLIDFLGWKGYRRGDAGVHERQALVLVNYGAAKGVEIAQLAKDIQADVLNKFGIELEAEVNFIGPRGPM